MIKQNLVTNNTYTLKDPDHDEIKDGYQLRWVGKNYSKLQENLLPETVIVPDSAHNSQDPNKDSQNLFLTGDNLEVLKHLEHTYTGKVDMIYIDPPYNTGSDGFVYNDDFRFTDEQLRDTLGLTDEEVKRVKNIYGKSSHSAWLTFMYPRLKIAKKLLKDSGVIFISIDDNEQANLKLLMDEVLNEGNFVGNIIVAKGTTTGQDASDIGSSVDYLLVYAKNKLNYIPNGLALDAQDIARFNLEDGRGKYSILQFRKTGTNDRREDRPNLYYPLIAPDGSTILPIGPGGYESCWRTNKKQFDLWTEEGFIEWKKSEGGDYKPYVKYYLEGRTKQVSNLWNDIEGNKKASITVRDLLGKNIFTNPKPIGLIKKSLEISSSKESIILDFFAGSGTTAHAVMDLNKQDGGCRHYIMCTLDEKVKEGSEAEKAGYKTIDEIARERIKRAAKQIGDTSGFRHYRFVKPNITTLDKIEKLVPSPIAPDDMITPFSEKELTGKGSASGIPTILTTWLVDDGYDFTTTPTPLDLAGYTAYYAEGIARIYLIEDKGWTSESCKALLNKLGKNEIAVNMIVVYPYSFNFVDLTELKNNIKANLDGKPEVYERY